MRSELRQEIDCSFTHGHQRHLIFNSGAFLAVADAAWDMQPEQRFDRNPGLTALNYSAVACVEPYITSGSYASFGALFLEPPSPFGRCSPASGSVLAGQFQPPHPRRQVK